MSRKDMRALVLNDIGQPLQLMRVPMPQSEPSQVIVQIAYAAINHRDIWIRKGQYANIKTPIVLGSDGAGYLNGFEVIINPSIRWGSTQSHQSAQYEILGLPNQGTFAEYVSVPVQQVYAKPEHLTLQEAAALPLAGLTAYRALFVQARLRADDRVLITGIGGGVAMLALQMAVANGNQVWVTSSKPEKIAVAQTLGAQGGALYTDPDFTKDLQAKTGGIDVIVDGTAGPTFSKLLNICNPGARMSVYGGTAGPITQLSPQQLFWKQLTLAGSTMGSPRDFEDMVDFVSRQRIKPVISRVFPLEEGNAAFDFVEQGQQSGKVVLAVAERFS